VSAQSLPPLPLKCYELFAFLADAKEPVHQDDIPKPLDGDPLTVCRGRGYIESYNANIEQRFPGACLRTQEKGGRRYYDYETRRWLGTIVLIHIRLSKEGRTCLAEYRLRCEPQSAKSKPPMLTEPLTKTQLGGYFTCHRNDVKKNVLDKYPHEIVGRKFRMRVADMPPAYHVMHRGQ
jgi:hypothetical protein